MLIFKGGVSKFLKSLGYSIISLATYWYSARNSVDQVKLHLVLPSNIYSLPVQISHFAGNVINERLLLDLGGGSMFGEGMP